MPSALNFLGSPVAPSPQRINENTSGDRTIVAASPGNATRVYALRLNVAGAVVVQVKTGGTIREVFNFAGAGGAIILDLRELPYYSTASNEALILNLSGAVQVDGCIEFSTSKA